MKIPKTSPRIHPQTKSESHDNYERSANICTIPVSSGRSFHRWHNQVWNFCGTQLLKHAWKSSLSGVCVCIWPAAESLPTVRPEALAYVVLWAPRVCLANHNSFHVGRWFVAIARLCWNASRENVSLLLFVFKIAPVWPNRKRDNYTLLCSRLGRGWWTLSGIELPYKCAGRDCSWSRNNIMVPSSDLRWEEWSKELELLSIFHQNHGLFCKISETKRIKINFTNLNV